MRKILVAVDGSRTSLAAMGWAARLAPGMNASLMVMTVAVATQAELRPAMVEADVDQHRQRLVDEWCRPLRDAGVAFEAIAVAGDPPGLILEIAERDDVAMIVIGTRGTGGFTGLPIGSVCDYVIHRTTRPVAVVPDTELAQVHPLRLLLGVDPADAVGAHTQFCADLALGLHADVIVVAAHHARTEWVPENDPRSWHTDMLQQLSTTWTRPLQAAHVPTTYRVEETGHPTKTLLDVAIAEHADIIVAGTRSISGWRMLRLGGVTVSLIHHTDRPVIIVPPAD